MKIIFALLLSLFCAQSTWAQNKIFSEFTRLEKIVPFHKPILKFDSYCLNFNIYNSSLIYSYYDANEHSDSIIIYKMSMDNFHIDTNYYVIKGISKYLLENLYNSVAFISNNSQFLVIGTFSDIYIFDSNQKLLKKIKNTKRFSYARFLDESQILLQVNRRGNTNISIFDVQKSTFTKNISPDFLLIQYTQFMPNKWIDATNKTILFAQTYNYHIKLYDTNLNLIDSINYEPQFWKRIPEKVEKEIFRKNLSGSDAIFKILPHEKFTSRLHQVHFINDSTILTNYSLANNSGNLNDQTYLFDVWEKNNNTWILSKDKYIETYVDNALITAENYPVFDGKLCKEFIFSKNNLIVFQPYAPIDPIGLTMDEYLNECNEYFMNNSPQLLIFIYSLTR